MRQGRGFSRGVFVLALPLLVVAAAGVAFFLLASRTELPSRDYARALQHFHRGEYAEALALLDGIAGIDARRLAGRAALAAGQPHRAIREFSAVLESEPKDYAATLGLARAYQAAGIDDLALHYYEAAARLQPDDPAPLKAAGLLHLKRGDRAQAMICLQEALALAPDDLEVLDLLSRTTREDLPFEEPRRSSPLGPELPDPLAEIRRSRESGKSRR